MINQDSFQPKMKKIECNMHGNVIRYKCEYRSCQAPYLCKEIQCLDSHFHEEDKLKITKFSSTLWKSRYEQAENIIKSNILKVKEQNLEKMICYFSQSLTKIKKKMEKFEQVKAKLCWNESQTINQKQFQTLSNFITLGSSLEKKIDKLRSKINEDLVIDSDSQSNEVIMEECPEIQTQQLDNQQRQVGQEKPKRNLFNVQDKHQIQDRLQEEKRKINKVSQDNYSLGLVFKGTPKNTQTYRENRSLQTFLLSKLSHFDWITSKILFSLKQPAISCQKFHQRLKGKRDLLFLFLSEISLIGSYYHQPYPSMAERFKKDPLSFIFIQDKELQQKFCCFKADPRSESHISISQKLLICQGNTPNNGDGLRTFQRTFENLVFYLPSKSFFHENEERTEAYHGALKIREFYVFQLQLNDR